jgi:tetratricopeptide (TPR) repeat protein
LRVTEAEELNERARELDRLGDVDAAVATYRAAISADPTWSVPWYNLGLLHKYRLEWSESARCNAEAARRDDSDEATWWNLGIAATALGDWPRAREAWTRCGINIPEGSGPIVANYGLTPIRLQPQTRGEVVWCERIDPARAIIRNIPLPESGHLFGDLLLHDGAPNGTRIRNGVEVPVFDALARIERSEYRTFILDVPGSSEEQRASIGEVAGELGMGGEDWSQSVSFLCRNCSVGSPHASHDSELRGERPDLAVAAAARNERELGRLIEAWRHHARYDGYVGTQPVDV